MRLGEGLGEGLGVRLGVRLGEEPGVGLGEICPSEYRSIKVNVCMSHLIWHIVFHVE